MCYCLVLIRLCRLAEVCSSCKLGRHCELVLVHLFCRMQQEPGWALKAVHHGRNEGPAVLEHHDTIDTVSTFVAPDSLSQLGVFFRFCWCCGCQVLDALNVLGNTSWRINRSVFDVMTSFWQARSTAGGLPAQVPIKQPQPPPTNYRLLYENGGLTVRSGPWSRRERRRYILECDDVRRLNRNMASLKSDFMLKIKVRGICTCCMVCCMIRSTLTFVAWHDSCGTAMYARDTGWR